MEIIFWSVTESWAMAQNVNQFLVRHKTFGPAQNILGPAEGRGKNPLIMEIHNSYGHILKDFFFKAKTMSNF